MKTAVLIGSPKSSKSNSLGCVTKILNYSKISDAVFIPENAPECYNVFLAADVVIIAYPLYADGLPSHLTEYLEELGAYIQAVKPPKLPKLYAVANLGFYEGEQGRWSLSMLRCFALRTGCLYEGGISIGAGGIIVGMKGPAGWVIGRSARRAMKRMAHAICSGTAAGEIYTHPDIPKSAYVKGGNASWPKEAAKYGLSTAELESQTPVLK